MNLEEFDALLSKTQKGKKTRTQLKLGGSFTDPETGFSTEDSLIAGGAFIPKRFKTPKKGKNPIAQIKSLVTENENIDELAKGKDNTFSKTEAKRLIEANKAKIDSIKANNPLLVKFSDTLNELNSLVNGETDGLKTELKQKTKTKTKNEPEVKIFNSLREAKKSLTRAERDNMRTVANDLFKSGEFESFNDAWIEAFAQNGITIK